MKAFYIIAATFIIMVGLISFNAKYVARFSEDSIKKIEAIDYFDVDVGEKKLTALVGNIEHGIEKMDFSIPRKKADALRDHSELLLTRFRLRDQSEFEATKSLLINLFKDIGRLEKIDISNIL